VTKEEDIICTTYGAWKECNEQRKELRAERDKLQRLLDIATDHSGYRNTIDRLRAERDKLKEEVERLNEMLVSSAEHGMRERHALRKRVSELEGALEKIKFRNHPGTTNHELAKEALSTHLRTARAIAAAIRARKEEA
jgi:uncharacterized coiled-coil DUF342 family protein